MRLLIVDDDPIVREFLSDALMRLGHEVACAKDGPAALEMLDRNDFPACIVDWEMPGMSGLELCAQIRRRDGQPGLHYLIMLTGRDSDLDMVDGLEAGADTYLPKPPDICELDSTLRIAWRLLA
jgi:DNA-binding response OmpR family regulator